MPYTYTLPKSTAFTGTGLEGYAFGPLRQNDLDVYYIESKKGHDTFMISSKITRTYYVLAGSGYFTIADERYDVYPGMLVEVPPKVEYTYSGQMTLIGFARPRWFRKNDTHTRWNPDVTAREKSSLPGHEPLLTRLVRKRIAGKSPLGVFLRLNRSLWRHIPSDLAGRGLVRSYGRFVHSVARRSPREQAFSTYFLRNRPALKLIQSLVDSKKSGEKVRVAVLGCSFGAEAYSVAYAIRSARPDLDLKLNAIDISRHAVEFARRGEYSRTGAEPSISMIFERLTEAEMDEMFEVDGDTATIRAEIRKGIEWGVGDVGEPELFDRLGVQDIVVASNFLCHMQPPEAERCLRAIGRLVRPGGYLFVCGIDLDVRTKVARDLAWEPVPELFEEIHEGDACLRSHYPCEYGGLEPLDKTRPDWKIRYAAAFQIGVDRTSSAPAGEAREEMLIGGGRK